MIVQGRSEEAMRRRHLVDLGVAAALLVVVWAPLVAQQRASERRVADPGETQFNIQLLRPSGRTRDPYL